ncbi:MAG: glucose PTS transporter subunit IIA [Clostridia bacterium]|nr:glucose PTS transporter subunit IIA [Clostridia bacterium]
MKDKVFGVLQRVGRSFMLPIAILPVAGLFLGIGGSFTNETMLATYGLSGIMGKGTPIYAILTVLNEAGNIVFANLPLLFAIGVAIGMAKKEKDVAALASVIAFFIMHASIGALITLNYGGISQFEAAKDITGATTNVLGINSLNMGVFGGIIVGLGVAALHNRFYKIQLPQVLSFFGGTRFVPIISAAVYLLVGILMYFIWPPIQTVIMHIGDFVQKSNYLGTFIYGVTERALIPFGLHHVFYIPFWQTSVGGVMEVKGQLIEGAQNIFFAQLSDPSVKHFAVSATRFMSGKFPLMIFGLPGAALAMYRCAKPERRKAVGGLLLSAALTSMLTGITEPLEFTFLFVAPFLYAIHCLFAGAAYMLMHIFGVGVGMTFSGGIIDMVLFGVMQGTAKTSWYWIVVVGAAYFAIYYFLFSFIIRKQNLKTPGREEEGEETKLYTRADVNAKKAASSDERSPLIVAGLGGKINISDVDCCATRLRVTVKDGTLVKQDILKSTGAAGVVQKGNGVQIIYGPSVTVVKSNLEAYLDSHGGDIPNKTSEIIYAPISGRVLPLSAVGDGVFSEEILGQGAAIDPTEGKVYAPFDGRISTVADTLHAIGITSKSGIELLIHVGIDTVQLKGLHYKAHVKAGDTVKKGDLLLEFDVIKIKQAGFKTITPIVIGNSGDYSSITAISAQTIEHGDGFINIEK